MTLVVAFIVTGAVAALGWRSLAPVFAAPLFQRENYRGQPLPTAAGIVLAAAVVVAAAVGALADALGADVGSAGARLVVVAAVGGFAFLGLVDDLAAAGADRGFRGHLRALAGGRLTTGGLKLAGGGALALAVVGPLDADRPARLLADGLLVALAANLGNLFDRAPGRTTKVGLLGFVVLAVATGGDRELVGVAAAAGAAAGLLVPDLREDLMLGDTGANALGAALGLGVVLACSPRTRLLTLLAVAALNVLSELVSFSRVIDAVPPLRFLDRAGRHGR